MDIFTKAFTKLIGNEGSYSNHSDDPGGETMWGITKSVALENGYRKRMIDMPLEVAMDIYKKQYWNKYIASLPYIVAFNIFDAAVNHGNSRAIKFAQKVVGVKEDGVIGEITYRAILTMSPKEFSLKFNGVRLQFYTSLNTWRSFGRGWTNRVAHNLQIEDE